MSCLQCVQTENPWWPHMIFYLNETSKAHLRAMFVPSLKLNQLWLRLSLSFEYKKTSVSPCQILLGCYCHAVGIQPNPLYSAAKWYAVYDTFRWPGHLQAYIIPSILGSNISNKKKTDPVLTWVKSLGCYNDTFTLINLHNVCKSMLFLHKTAKVCNKEVQYISVKRYLQTINCGLHFFKHSNAFRNFN